MKRLFYFMTLAAALTAVACQRELPGKDKLPGKDELPTVFRTVSVNLGTEEPVISTDGSVQADTKSLITVDAEDFVDAYLFCFNASAKSIETYDNGLPVATYTTSKTFDWALPIDKSVDIWVVVNPGTENAWKTTLQNAVTNASLKESDLSGDKLMFTCASSSALKALETSGANLPMSGVVSATKLTSHTQTLSIKVKRLFAKYNIYFDLSVLEAEGYTVKSTYLASSKSNTEVPFFYFTGSELGGYKQSTSSKLAIIDRNSEADLQTLENGEKVTLYFLENCQGTISGASSWSSVYDDLGDTKVQNCSYIEVGVNISRDADATHKPVDKSYAYRIYLGESDMKSNFNVKRNLFKTIKLKLPNPDAIIIKDGFEFTNTNSLSVAPGESITVPFETSVNNRREIAFKITQGDVDKSSLFTITPGSITSNTTNKTDFDYQGTVTLKASSTANEGTYYKLIGNAGEKFSDEEFLYISHPLSTITNTITVYTVDLYSNGVVYAVINIEKELKTDVELNVGFGPPPFKVILPAGSVGMFTPIQTTAINGIFAYTSQCSYAGQTPAAGESVTKTISHLSIAQDENYKYIVNKQGGQFRLMGEKKAASDSFAHYINVRIQRPSSVSPYGYILDITSDLPEYDKLQERMVNTTHCYLCLQVKDSQNRYFWIMPYYLGRSVSGSPLFDIKYIYNGSWSDGVDRTILYDNYITKSNVYPTWINYYTMSWEPLMYDTITWVNVKFNDILPASTKVSAYETH